MTGPFAMLLRRAISWLSATKTQPLLLFTAACLVIGEQYPFSNFPMYSSFGATTYYVYLTNGADEPVHSQELVGMATTTLKKVYDGEIRREATRLGVPRRRLTSDQKRAVGERILAQLKTTGSGHRSRRGFSRNAAPLPRRYRADRRPDREEAERDCGTAMSWAPPKVEYGALERAAMRLLFAIIVARHVPTSLAHLQITLPNGLARLVDLHFLLNPEVFAIGHYLLWAALTLYVLRIGWSIALPYMTAFSIAAGSVNNSHGAISHHLQIVALVLCAQTAAHFYSLLRKNRDHHPAAAARREQRVIYWSQQAIVATYVVSAVMKLIRTSGMWFFQSPLVALQIIKTNDQDRYDNPGSGSYESAAAIAEWIMQHPFITGVVLSTGLLLELIAPIALFGRVFAAGYGLSLLLFHATVHRVMKLHFLFNEYLIWIYLVNVPFWILLAFRAVQRGRVRQSTA